MSRRDYSATAKALGARRVRDKLIDQTLFLVRALTFHYPAHLQPAARGYRDRWNWFVCLHLPTGPVCWRVTPEEEQMFSHLRRAQDHPWDRATHQDRIDRLAALTGNTLQTGCS